MMRKRRTLLLAVGGTAALGACSFSLEHGLFNPCRARLPREPASDERVLAAWEGIESSLVPVLAAVREHNPLLFDFVLKRQRRAGDKRFPRSVFETRRFFDAQESAASARLPRAG